MVTDVQKHSKEIAELCAQFDVRSLFLFGSAARDQLTDASDLDFLVEFDRPEVVGYADRFFGLQEGLEALFHRPVDLVVESAIRNPYFREAVQRQRVLLYAA